MFDLLKTLCELPGPGGDEGAVQDFLEARWSGRVQSARRTKVNNLIAEVGGAGKRLMIAGHADEICFVVKHIAEEGFLWIASGQRDIEQRPTMRSSVMLPLGHPALVVTRGGGVPGVFATLTGHVQRADQRAKTQLDWHEVWVDIGATSRADALARGVRVGDRVIWNPPTRRVGDLAYGKAMDNRVAYAVMDRLLDVVDRSRLRFELVYASTIQEEIGLYGAESIAYEAGADLAIAIDIGLAGDVPGVDARDVSARLGAGPTVVHKDLYHYDRALTLELLATAERAGVPVQPQVFNFYGSDAGAFIRGGVPSALVVVPTRYTHSPFEMLHLGDVEHTVGLLKAFVEAP